MTKLQQLSAIGNDFTFLGFRPRKVDSMVVPLYSVKISRIAIRKVQCTVINSYSQISNQILCNTTKLYSMNRNKKKK